MPSPTDWVFGVLTVVFVLTAAGTWLLPESSPRLPGAVASLGPSLVASVFGIDNTWWVAAERSETEALAA